MIAEELINQMIPPLKLTDTAQQALHWMEELRVTQLPIVSGQEYKGLISEDLIYQNNDPDALLSEFTLESNQVYAYKYQHFFDVLKIALDNNVGVVAVLDESRNFVGVITITDTLTAFARSSMQEPGGILVLLMDERDYSLSEVSRLVESNDAKILSSYVCSDKGDATRLKLTIKINRNDLSRIIATFERFSYNIVAKFHHTQGNEDDKERIDLLLRYLNM
jgi:CBS domain-containing protein